MTIKDKFLIEKVHGEYQILYTTSDGELTIMTSTHQTKGLAFKELKLIYKTLTGKQFKY